MEMFNAAATAAVLPYASLVPALRRATLELASGAIRAPERQVVPIDAGSLLLSMPALASDIGITKLITVHRDNARHGLPVIQGEVMVFEAQTGRRLAMLDGPTVTARRTAAMSLLGIETLLRRKPASVLLIGAGVQAQAHAEALIAYCGMTQFWVAARRLDTAAGFCARLRAAYPQVTARPVASPAESPGTDLVIALTTSTTPVIPADLSPGTLAIGVGAFTPQMAEFPPELLHSRAIVVDDLAGAQHEAGDLLQANVEWRGVTPLAAWLDGPAGLDDGVVPVFKTVGQAAWDLAAARVALSA